MKRNLTVQLDEEIVAKAKVLAARTIDISEQARGHEIQKLVAENEAYERARTAALSHLNRGFHLGGDALPDRSALHDR